MNSQHSNIKDIIKGCKRNQRHAQKELYQTFYSYALNICMRYSNDRDDAVEIMNNGFMKIFTYIRKFNSDKPFLPWLKKIMINKSIDHFNKQQKRMRESEIVESIEQTINNSALDKIGYEELLSLVRSLPPAYKIVFNLIAIEGYKHHEVAKMLGISEGTSKSNYARARKKLQDQLITHFNIKG